MSAERRRWAAFGRAISLSPSELNANSGAAAMRDGCGVVPDRVSQMSALALELGFAQSCEPDVGRLLLVLAAAVRPHGRILEIGTGAGVGTAWLVEGVAATPGIELITIEVDETFAGRVAAASWPTWVDFVVDDALTALPRLGQFDLVFADAIAGKWHGLDLTIDAVAPGGLLAVDDMSPPEWVDEDHEVQTKNVRTNLLTDPRLSAVEINWASGVILASRRTA